MGKLFDLKLEIEKIIKEKNLNSGDVKGQIAMKSGVLLLIVSNDTPDDDEKILKIKKAIKEILDMDLE